MAGYERRQNLLILLAVLALPCGCMVTPRDGQQLAGTRQRFELFGAAGPNQTISFEYALLWGLPGC
jgi:hypothetical protein